MLVGCPQSDDCLVQIRNVSEGHHSMVLQSVRIHDTDPSPLQSGNLAYMSIMYSQ